MGTNVWYSKQVAEPHLECPGGSDNDGAYALKWSGTGTHWQLQENGLVLYDGPDTGTTVTGRAAGKYEYRAGIVKDDGSVGAWSKPCTVQVDPPSLALAFGLAGIGAVVFIATITMLRIGDRRTREDRA